MLPNLYLPPLKIYGPLEVGPFAVLVGIAVLTGCELAYQRARRTGLNIRFMVDATIWAVGIGFLVAHWVEVLFYHPQRILSDPVVLVRVWDGFSSFGGFFGGILGIWVYLGRKKVPSLPYIEAFLFGFVPAWVIGRLGCTMVFDHPGLPTDFFLGMADRAGVVRHNLGFYEMLLALALTGVLYGLRNVRPFHGFHSALVIVIYAPVRWFLDTLRVADKTYWGWSPGQYGALILLGVGVFLIIRGLRLKRFRQNGLN